MAYDRRGRKVSPKANEDAVANAGTATPNAARLASGGRVSRKAAAKAATDGAPSGPAIAAKTAKSAGFLQRFRILPLVIVVGVGLLSVKAHSLWTSPESWVGVSVTTLAPATVDEGAAPITAASVADAQAAPAPIVLAQATTEEAPVDPTLFTRSEIELLQDLRVRREEIERREDAVIQKEGLLKAAEDRIEKKIAELSKIRVDIEALIKKYDEQEEQQIKDLVAIYEKMKPKDAAKIFDELDLSVLLQMFDKMKSSKSAPILASMRPARAKQLTAKIAERRQMPKLN